MFFFSSRRRHTRWTGDWSSDVCSSDLLDGTVTHGEGSLTVNGKAIKVIAERDPGNLPWKDLKVDLVLECSGLFTARDKAEIGRASCRERVESGVGGWCVNEKKVWRGRW